MENLRSLARSPLTIAKALSLYDFRLYRSGDAPAECSTGGIFLTCSTQVTPQGDVVFRILQGFDFMPGDAAAKVTIDSERWNDCSASTLFALIGEVPKNKRADLLLKIHDAILVRRPFTLPFDRPFPAD